MYVRHGAFFMASYVEFYNEVRVHWQLLPRKVSMDYYFSFLSCHLAIWNINLPQEKTSSKAGVPRHHWSGLFQLDSAVKTRNALNSNIMSCNIWAQAVAYW